MVNEPHNIRLAARLDLAEVNTLAATLLAIEPDTQVVLDAVDVIYFGSLCAQTIISGARRSVNHGGQYEISNLNDQASEQLAAMGLSENTLTKGQQ